MATIWTNGQTRIQTGTNYAAQYAKMRKKVMNAYAMQFVADKSHEIITRGLPLDQTRGQRTDTGSLYMKYSSILLGVEFNFKNVNAVKLTPS